MLQIRISKAKIIITLLLLSIGIPLLAQDTGANILNLENRKNVYPVMANMRYHMDHNNQLTPESVRELAKAQWTAPGNHWLSLPPGPEAMWIRFQARTSQGGAWLLISEFAPLDRLELFIYKNGRLENALRAGDAVSKPIQTDPHRFPVFKLKMDAGQNYEFYLKVTTNTTRTISLKFLTRRKFYQLDNQEVFQYTLLFIVALLVILMNLVQAVRNRSGLPLLYIMLVMSYILYQLKIAGFLSSWFRFMEEDYSDRVIMLSGGLTVVAFMLLWRALLLMRIHTPRLDRLLLIQMILLLLVLSGVVLPEPSAVYIRLLDLTIKLALFAFVPILFISGFIALRKKYKPAVYSIWAGMSQMVFMSVYILIAQGVITANFSLLYVLWVGYLVEGLLFFLSLSRRIKFANDLKDDYGDAPEKKLLEIYKEEKVEVGGKETELYRQSKITLVDSQEKADMLRVLMEEDKIFCDDDLSLEVLGVHLELKVQQVSELLNGLFGKGFYRYVNEYRVQEAAALLLEDRKRSVVSVALAVGFSSKSSFNAEFKRVMGETPSGYRRKGQEPGAKVG